MTFLRQNVGKYIHISPKAILDEILPSFPIKSRRGHSGGSRIFGSVVQISWGRFDLCSLTNFSWNFPWKWNNLDPGGGSFEPPEPPLDPPLGVLIREGAFIRINMVPLKLDVGIWIWGMSRPNFLPILIVKFFCYSHKGSNHSPLTKPFTHDQTKTILP